jgi:RNA polymerase sigma-70 factor (ECF subfamily)
MDGGLIERARAGDANAFDELARSRIDTVYRTALAILGSPADARDATQETLVSMWRGLPSLRNVEAFDGWLHRVTVNSSKMALRRKRGIREIQITDENVGALPHASTSVDDSDFDRAFDRLNVDQRALIVAHHLDGASLSDLARTLDIPQGTVKSRLFNARAALDRALEEERR